MEVPPSILNESNEKIQGKEDFSIFNLKKEIHSQNSEIIKFEMPNIKNEKLEIQNEKVNIQKDPPNIQKKQSNSQIDKTNIQFRNEYPITSPKRNKNIYENQEILVK